MARKKKAVPPSDEVFVRVDPQSVRKRMSEFVNVRFDGNWSEFARALGAPPTTVEEWKSWKRGWPSFELLLKLPERQLSLDWLFLGYGSMFLERYTPTTEVGQLLSILRPRIRKLAEVSEFVEEQAFGQLLFKLGIDGTLDLAARSFVQHYRDVEHDLKHMGSVSALSKWFHERLVELNDAIAAESRPNARKPRVGADPRGVREILFETVSRIEATIPGWLRLENARATLEQAQNERARQVMKQARELDKNPTALTIMSEVATALEAASKELSALGEEVQQPYGQLVIRLEHLQVYLAQLAANVSALKPVPQRARRTTASRKPRRRQT